MGEKDISEWFRRAYYEEVRDAFEPNTDTNIPEKPSEWSEEDERNIRNLESVLYYDKYLSDETRTELGNFLKSLRPSWKPTEEQIEVLHTAIYLPEMRYYGGLKDKLRDLYKQLKKIKEDGK